MPFASGNLSQILDTQGWDFHAELAEGYGSVVKIHGLFGVRCLLYARHLFDESSCACFKQPWLYVFDPLALQHILRDSHTYDELPWYIQYVHAGFLLNRRPG